MKVKSNKNKGCSSASKVILSKIDIKSGDMTFGKRIELGEIFQSEISEIEMFEKVFECLHQYKPKASDYEKLLGYFSDIVEGIRYWLEAETTMLQYEPSSEEMQAGIKELSTKIGEYGTIKALAKAYSKDPDEVLEWKYSKVFGILYTDLEEFKYQKAYNKVLERKSKAK